MQKTIISDVYLGTLSRGWGQVGILLTVVLACSLLASTAGTQDSTSALPQAVQNQMDSLASRVAEQIRRSKIDPESVKFFVFDFSNATDKQCSKLGGILADRFSTALASHADGFVVLDRQILTTYLKDNWIDQKEIQGNGIALALARFLGATGILQGDLQEDPENQLLLTLRLEGFGPAWSAGSVINSTAEMKALSKELLPTFMNPSPMPTEPGMLIAGYNGVGLPECIYCPPPLYDDAARAAKYQGNIVLSVVVTPDGRSSSIFVLKGAPFLLNKQAMEAVQKWKFKPAQKNGQAIAVRVPIEITFRVN